MKSRLAPFTGSSQTPMNKTMNKTMNVLDKLSILRIALKLQWQIFEPQRVTIQQVPLNLNILSRRESSHEQRKTGSFRLLSTTCETRVLPPPPSRIISDKAYVVEESEEFSIHDVLPPKKSAMNDSSRNFCRNLTRKIRLPERVGDGENHAEPNLTRTLFDHADWAPLIKQARRKALDDLIQREVFTIVNKLAVPSGRKIFGLKWVDEIENDGTPAVSASSRLVIEAFTSKEKSEILTQLPTIDRVSQRIILSIAASKLDDVKRSMNLLLRDRTEPNAGPTSNIDRQFFARPPPELGLAKKLLKIEKQLSIIPQAGNHRFKTYYGHHVYHLGLKPCARDRCLLHTEPQNSDFGLMGIQSNDTLILCDKNFAMQANNNSTFYSKPCQLLSIENPLISNGDVIGLTKFNELTLTQERHCDKIKILKGLAVNKDQYISQRARGEYIAAACQPEASFDLSYATKIMNLTKADVENLNRRLQWQKDNNKRGLKFVKLDLASMKLVTFTDSSFASNRDLTSQIGFITVMIDKFNTANILDWQSVKCKKSTRSILASQIYAMALGFDHSSAIKITLDDILGQSVPLIMCTDSRPLFERLVTQGVTQDERPIPDLMHLRKAHKMRDIAEILFIDDQLNPAHSMTKARSCASLTELVDLNRLEFEAKEWVMRNSG